jgi:hypothetical protein
MESMPPANTAPKDIPVPAAPQGSVPAPTTAPTTAPAATEGAPAAGPAKPADIPK